MLISPELAVVKLSSSCPLDLVPHYSKMTGLRGLT